MWTTQTLTQWGRRSALMASAGAALYSSIAWGATTLGTSPETMPPLGVIQAGKPMVMLVASRDHKLFYEAYNDASDIDGDGTLDTRFNPGITYLGLYEPALCYTYNGSGNTGLFSPSGVAGAQNKCPGSWSGNWLNYMTTSRIDALRRVLYGGYREVDSTTQTILRRSYIPQDAHSWGKEYHESHGYKISDYTTLTQPTSSSHRHFFGSLTANRTQSCATLNSCSDLPPLLRVRTNVKDKRIWEWASKERPVLDTTLTGEVAFPSGTGAEQNFTVRVLSCTSTYNTGCKKYPNGQYKPTGVLHDYGETDAMLFGLITGSYDKHMSGGRLRKVVSAFSEEVSPSTGQFTASAQIVNTFNKLRIRGFNQSSSSSEYWKSNPYADSAKAATEGQLVDWGNPMGEMLYEAIRYFGGRKAATSAFSSGTTHDSAVGLTSATWDDPYSNTSAAKAPWCARASLLTISDVNVSYDSDSVPGSAFNMGFSGDAGEKLNAQTYADKIGTAEGIDGRTYFIGQNTASNGSYDAAPTAKTVAKLGAIRGLAPEEPTKQGSYYSAAVAHYARTNDLHAEAEGKQTADTYVVALSSPLPKIEAVLSGGKKITVVPFAKSVGGSGISATKGNYQPTNQIVDFYVESIANSGALDKNDSINGGRYSATFLINYEDVEQGGDHDMDAIARYKIEATSDNKLQITVTPTYQAGGIQQNMGYVVSGSTADGVYLVARDETGSPGYFLNVPANQTAGYCNPDTSKSGCNSLPAVGAASIPTFTFSPASTGAAAELLKDPLWYAAKWGGFTDRNGNNTPDDIKEWGTTVKGVDTPNNYFLVQNPARLRESLSKAFNTIYESNAAAGNVTANGQSYGDGTSVFQSTFNSGTWTGDLSAYSVSATGVSTTAKWKASQKLPANPNSRRILAIGNNGAAFSFTYAAMSTVDRELFDSNDGATDAAEQQKIINYLRGNRGDEVINGGTLRSRSEKKDSTSTSPVLGDFVHSSPYYSKEPDTVFVGSNSGMLHAFNAKTGEEHFAFVPRAAMLNMKDQAYTNYVHRYGVDGEIVVSDKARTGNSNYLVGFLGQGGKGLYVLDVTTPASFGASHYKWSNHGTTDADLGYLLGRPTIAKAKNGTNIVLFGNGYNSTNQRAVLYVYKLETGELLAKLDTKVGSSSDPNGLATPGVTYAADGSVEHVYAGDMKGNVWKFDLSNTDVSQWAFSFQSGSTPLPLFTATDSGGQAQPITAQITVTVNDAKTDPNYGKRFLFFGTGSYMGVGDPANTNTQSLYALIDNNARITSKSLLTRRAVEAAGIVEGRTVRTFSTAASNDMSGKSGWYLDWLNPSSGAGEGERVVSSARIFKTITSVLLVSSIIPVDDPCVPGGRGHLNALSPFSGTVAGDIFNIDGKSTTRDQLGTTDIGSIDLGIGLPSEFLLIGEYLVGGGSEAKIGAVKVNLPATGGYRGRISWREIVR